MQHHISSRLNCLLGAEANHLTRIHWFCQFEKSLARHARSTQAMLDQAPASNFGAGGGRSPSFCTRAAPSSVLGRNGCPPLAWVSLMRASCPLACQGRVVAFSRPMGTMETGFYQVKSKFGPDMLILTPLTASLGGVDPFIRFSITN